MNTYKFFYLNNGLTQEHQTRLLEHDAAALEVAKAWADTFPNSEVKVFRQIAVVVRAKSPYQVTLL